MAGLHVVASNDLSEIPIVDGKFREFGDGNGLDKDVIRKMSVILDELLNNVISYAFPDGGEHEIELRAELVGGRMTITISDDGIPFNPLGRTPPNVGLTVEDREIGGLGIQIVRKMVDDISYQRHIDKNVLTLVVHVARASAISRANR